MSASVASSSGVSSSSCAGNGGGGSGGGGSAGCSVGGGGPAAPSSGWTLSMYELHRRPQQVLAEDITDVAAPPQSLRSELKCPICLELLSNTMTAMGCLHRYCSDCITTALRAGNKECPTCRKKLVSKRSLRRDEAFDRLISAIYPRRDEYEAQQQRLDERMRQYNDTAPLAANMVEGMRAQLQNRAPRAGARGVLAKRRASSSPGDAEESVGVGVSGAGGGATTNGSGNGSGVTASDVRGAAASGGDTVVSSGGGGGAVLASEAASEAGNFRDLATADSDAVDVDIVLRPHPDSDPRDGCQESPRAAKFLKTTSFATIEHIAKYLVMREDIVANAADSAFSVYAASASESGSLTSLPNNMLLREVLQMCHSTAETLELFYKKNIEVPPASIG